MRVWAVDWGPTTNRFILALLLICDFKLTIVSGLPRLCDSLRIENGAHGERIALLGIGPGGRRIMAKRAKPSLAKTASAGSDHGQSGAISRENAQHYRWGVDSDGWHLVLDKNLSVIEELMPPGAAEIRHHHQFAQQFFYVLDGEILMEVEGENTLVPAGSGIRILPGMWHQVRNPTPGAVRFLVISQPPSRGDRIEEGR